MIGILCHLHNGIKDYCYKHTNLIIVIVIVVMIIILSIIVIAVIDICVVSNT